MITGAHVLSKVKGADDLFDPGKFDLRFHPGVSKTLTTFEPSVLFFHYGVTDLTKQVLAAHTIDDEMNAKDLLLHGCETATLR